MLGGYGKCRDCEKLTGVHKPAEWFRVTPPRCSACGGMLDRQPAKPRKKWDGKISHVSYFRYIAGKKWKKKRAWAMRRLGQKCSICGSTEMLGVHHKNYDNLGRERILDLQVLCRGCHENEHEGKVPGVFDPMTREYLGLFK